MSTHDTSLIDALAQKAAKVERCVARARQELAASANFETDFTRQDAAILNIQRACELTLDMGNMIVRHLALGLPRSSRDVFGLLAQHGWVDKDQATTLQHMVGFRNIAVHEYDALDMAIVRSIIEKDLQQILQFAGQVVLKLSNAPT
ncbi:MAG: DUF86 domain-containing protein [Burkholderiaceae bacterium]|nr:DUF86 domain-containing protein [Burkholderiaceae bacterium]